MDELQEIYWRMLRVAVALVTICAVGILGYHYIEGWSYFDSLYMTIITLATVGYGETHPLNTFGRIFTIFLILFGIGILTYGISTLTAFIVEGDLRDVLRRRKMEAKIAKLSGHYIICGAGHTGETIMEELMKTSRAFVVIDRVKDVVDHLQSRGVLALHGDATDDEALKLAGIERAKGLFAAFPTDPDNVFVTISARVLNPDLRIVSRQVARGVAEKLKRSGANVAVDPGSIGGLRMASEMIRPAAVGFLDSMIRAEGKVLRIEDVPVPEGSKLDGKPLGDLKGGEGSAALVLAVRDAAGAYDINPSPSRAVRSGEVLVAMGAKDQLKELQEKLAA